MQARSVVRLSPLLVALALGVVPVLFASTQGCSSTPDAATGSAEFIATTAQELTSADVTRVTITITGAGIATPITHDLVRVNGQWRGTIGAIPVGTGRNFHGDAFNAAGATVYRGDVSSVTITKGATAVVALLMQQVQAPTPFRNSAPRIDSTTASSNAVAPSDVVSLAATAHDPDGDALTFAWSATGGTFTGASTLSPQWTAPAGEGSYSLTMRATDPKGAVATTTLSVNVAVSNGRGNADVTTTLNTWPEVARVNASPTRIDVGESTTLSIVASDADNDALHYAWAATCAGTFDNAASQAPSFTLAAPLPAGNACALVATVTDGRGGTNTGQISVTTGPGAPVGLAPVIDSTFQSSTTATEGQNVILRLGAHDPEGTAIAFAWSSASGTLGAPTSNGQMTEVTWTAPSGFSGNASISVTVTDASGASTIRVFTVVGPNPFKRVFVSSTTSNANLGGLLGADAKCQTLAANAGLTGTFRAWLSDFTISAGSRLTHAAVPYVLVNGTPVASNWASLTSGTLLHAIDTTELNAPAPASSNTGCPGSDLVFTNTRSDGSLGNNGDSSCTNWTDGSTSLGGGNGSFFGRDDAVTYFSDWCAGGSCAATAPIYCIEQ